jgi:hypothetical protein
MWKTASKVRYPGFKNVSHAAVDVSPMDTVTRVQGIRRSTGCFEDELLVVVFHAEDSQYVHLTRSEVKLSSWPLLMVRRDPSRNMSWRRGRARVT